MIDNTEDFLENILNKSLFESEKVILINRCTDKIVKIFEDLTNEI